MLASWSAEGWLYCSSLMNILTYLLQYLFIVWFCETDPQNLKKMNEAPCFRLQAPSMRIQLPPSQLNTRCRQWKQFQFIKSYRIPRTPWHVLAPCRCSECSGSSSLCSLVDRSKSAKRPVRHQGPVARHKPPWGQVTESWVLTTYWHTPNKRHPETFSEEKRKTCKNNVKHVKDVFKFKHLQSIFSRKWREPHSQDCLCASRLGFPTQGNYSSFPRCCISGATKDSHLTSQIVGLREPQIMSHGGHHWAKAANSHLWKERLELKRWYWNHLRVTLQRAEFASTTYLSLLSLPCLNQQKRWTSPGLREILWFSLDQ